MIAKYAESGNTELSAIPEGRRTCPTAKGKTADDLRDDSAESHFLIESRQVQTFFVLISTSAH